MAQEQREIKFRVWSLKHKCWMNHCAVIDCPGNIGSHFVAKHDDGRIEQMFVSLSKEENIVQQFTGLEDKNGKEIYEGDIIKGIQVYFDYKKETWVEIPEKVIAHVWYYDIDGEWTASRNHLYSESACELKNIIDKEIIGNIFENSELLKSKE